MRVALFFLIIGALSSVLSGCVRRTLVITTEPSDALVYLNDEESGRSKLTADFTWYGDYDVVIRKPGYETLTTHWRVKAPWYQMIPFDFLSEVFWPGKIHDVHERHFVLVRAEVQNRDELTSRAIELRHRANNPRR